ncbi:small acidic protein family protein [Sarocladium implicatum]|nr:small acidic protein family protein [Sarocladium implicatum]
MTSSIAKSGFSLRKEAGREKLREKRKAKRHEKAAAKAARKTNVNPAAKWTKERIEEMKLKGEGKKAAKWETLRLSLPKKAAKARAKAEELLKDAKKYDLQYTQMTKEKEAREAAERLAADDDVKMGSGSSSDSDSSSSSDSEDEEGGVPVPAAVPSDEVDLKKRKEKEDSSSDSDTSSDADSESDSESESESEPEPEPEPKKVKKVKKNKKNKKEEKKVVIDKKAAKKAAKAEKKRKRSADDESEDEAPKEKPKKSKKKTEAAMSNDTERWSVAELDGGAARQDKFMRLLGGKKAGAAAGHAGKGVSRGKSNSVKAAADIERQFEDGMKAKHGGGGQRRGLGA